MRGENVTIEALEYLDVGTSPRARGKRRAVLVAVTWCGNIPACAGKTIELPVVASAYTEHPRVRGENSTYL